MNAAIGQVVINTPPSEVKSLAAYKLQARPVRLWAEVEFSMYGTSTVNALTSQT